MQIPQKIEEVIEGALYKHFNNLIDGHIISSIVLINSHMLLTTLKDILEFSPTSVFEKSFRHNYLSHLRTRYKDEINVLATAKISQMKLYLSYKTNVGLEVIDQYLSSKYEFKTLYDIAFYGKYVIIEPFYLNSNENCYYRIPFINLIELFVLSSYDYIVLAPTVKCDNEPLKKIVTINKHDVSCVHGIVGKKHCIDVSFDPNRVQEYIFPAESDVVVSDPVMQSFIALQSNDEFNLSICECQRIANLIHSNTQATNRLHILPKEIDTVDISMSLGLDNGPNKLDSIAAFVKELSKCQIQ